MNRKELESLIVEWGKEKGIDSIVKQTLKTLSEAGELADAVAKQDAGAIIDAIGDIEVCLTILKDVADLPQDKPLEIAWHEIKNRKGKTVDGVFIKE